MAAITFRTLRDYASTYQLHADCPSCRHHVALNPMRVSLITGWDVDLESMRRNLRCTQCGAKGAEIRLTHDGRPAIWRRGPLAQQIISTDAGTAPAD